MQSVENIPLLEKEGWLRLRRRRGGDLVAFLICVDHFLGEGFGSSEFIPLHRHKRINARSASSRQMAR